MICPNCGDSAIEQDEEHTMLEDEETRFEEWKATGIMRETTFYDVPICYCLSCDHEWIPK